MINFETFEKLLKHVDAGHLDMESYSFSKLIDFKEILENNPEFISKLDDKNRYKLMYFIIETNKNVLKILENPQKLVNEFFDNYLKEELPENDLPVKEILKVLLEYNKNDFGTILNWIESYIKKVNKSITDYNKNEHFLTVFNEIALSDLKEGENFSEKDLYIDLSEQEFYDFILSETISIHMFSVAKVIVANWIERNQEIVSRIDISKKMKLFNIFPNIYKDEQLYRFFKDELLVIKEQLPNEEAYAQLSKIMNLSIYNADVTKPVLKTLLIDENIIDKKYFSKSYLEKEGIFFVVSSTFSLMYIKDFNDVYEHLNIDYLFFFNLKMDMVESEKRKSFLYSKLKIEDEMSESEKTELIKRNISDVDIIIPRDAHYKLLAEFPQLGKTLLFSKITENDGECFSILVFYILHANEDLSLSEELFEILKMNFKR